MNASLVIIVVLTTIAAYMFMGPAYVAAYLGTIIVGLSSFKAHSFITEGTIPKKQLHERTSKWIEKPLPTQYETSKEEWNAWVKKYKIRADGLLPNDPLVTKQYLFLCHEYASGNINGEEYEEKLTKLIEGKRICSVDEASKVHERYFPTPFRPGHYMMY